MNKEEKRVTVDVLGRCGIWKETGVGPEVAGEDLWLYQRAIGALSSFAVFNFRGDPPSASLELANVGRKVPGGKLQLVVKVTPGDHCRLCLPTVIAHCFWCGREAPDLAVVQGTFRLVWDKVSLDLEVVKPPEEEEVPEAPSADEEVKPEVVVEEPPVKEGTPLKVLGLSKRVYNLLAKHFQPLLGRSLFVEDILAILDDESRGEDFLLSGCVKNFGPKALEELKNALWEKCFVSFPTQEPGKRELVDTLIRSE